MRAEAIACTDGGGSGLGQWRRPWVVVVADLGDDDTCREGGGGVA